MKKSLITFALLIACSFASVAQSIMVFPSDVWMKQNGYGREARVQGEMQFVCDYGLAFRSCSELKDIITRFGKLFKSKGYEIQPLDVVLKDAKVDQTLAAGDELPETPTDMILKAAQPDVKVDLSWETKKTGFNYTVDINVEALDPYTSGLMSAISFSSPEPTKILDIKSEVETMLNGDFSGFMDELQASLTDRAENGQKIKVEIRTAPGSEYTPNSMIEGKPLGAVVRKFIGTKAYNGKMGKSVKSENSYTCRDVRVDATNSDAIEDLQNDIVDYISNTLGVPCYAPYLRLGTVVVYLGENSANSI